jgi:hypothetical protein
MQNTRLNQLFDQATDQVVSWLSNPWRRLSLLLISVLFGFFLGGVMASIAGQTERWDGTVAALAVVWVEVVSRLAYRVRANRDRPFPLDLANYLKMGFTYSLFLEAFKLGS